MEPAGSHRTYCVSERKDTVFLGANGEVADLPFGVNIVAMVKMSLISAEGTSNVVPPTPYFSSSPEQSSPFLLHRAAIPVSSFKAEW